MIHIAILYVVLRLLSGIFYRCLGLRVCMLVLVLVLMLLLVVVIVLLLLMMLRLGLVLLLLAVSPALHHWMFCCWCLTKTMVCLYGCDVSSRVLWLLLYLVHLHRPGLASIVLGSRVEIVGQIIMREADSGHGEV